MIKYFLKRIWDDINDLPDEVHSIIFVALVPILGVINFQVLKYIFGMEEPAELAAILIIPELISIPLCLYLRNIYEDYECDKEEKYRKEIRNGTKWKD
jgi:hypothetical protein